ncbi:MAG: hypothetical protein A3F83_15165 [Candidatus Glassbacteria bacterium RIFCSPLOWO2_12_FULL_58_11]|uniref:FlgD/Vpr Ig-like domain-containing protein n=1 Tax=Candidatus Glassbacteria bacterium RIFCSPLOWO2_12_FULL_58_11 TaxID=1817867 RepID=A0A1F5Z2B9_9BACT|nr:MAG: hypothetical protein A3F83_15165 [Candidatus Glassbacteria bacterium RIFCSPLOWO2_12_FULL_58_11]
MPEAESTSTITIHDLQGKILKTARPGKTSGEKTIAFWNGKEEEGKALGSGIYSIKLTVNDSTYSEQLIQIH